MRKLFAAVIITAALAPSCARESIPLTPVSSESALISFTGIDYTKTLLTEGIENRVSGVKLALYDSGGTLEATAYSESGYSEGMSVTINGNDSHNVYALVNMGDLSVPYSEDEMKAYEYYIESYDEIDKLGLPMYGSTSIAIGESACTVSLSRLMARLDLSLVGGEVEPDQVTSVTLCNWNKRLTPFAGSSAAEDESDLESGGEGMSEALDGWDGEELVFYVPENMQGTLMEGNSDPTLKTPDGLAAYGHEGAEELCTYIEVGVYIDPDTNTTGVSGSLSYRFYLGSDTVSDFNVKGNTAYSLSFSLSWNGMFYEDCWLVNNEDLNDSRALSLSTITVTPLSDGYELSSSDSGLLTEGWETAVYVKLNANGSDIGDTSYGTVSGWCVPDSCISRLSNLGIDCEVVSAKMMYDSDSFMPCYLRSGGQAESSWEDIGEQERLCVLLSMDEYDYSQASTALTVQTTDGEQSASIEIDLRPYVSPDVTLARDDGGHYIAQRHLLSASGLPDEVSFRGYSVMNSDDGIVSLTAKNLLLNPEYFIDMLKKGTAYIKMSYSYEVDGKSVNGSQIIKSVEVKAPYLKFEVNELTISTAKSKYTILLAYYDDDGNLIACSGTSLKTPDVSNISLCAESVEADYPDEDEFYRELFESMLTPVVMVENYEEEEYFYRMDDSDDDDTLDDGYAVGVKCSAEADGVVYCYITTGTATEIDDSHELGYVIANATDCDDIAPDTITVWIADESLSTTGRSGT